MFDSGGAVALQVRREYGIAEPSVFGSVARGEATPDSDVDLLYVRVLGSTWECRTSPSRRIWKSSSGGRSISSRRTARTG
jgi:hypothetical protein